MTAQQRSTRDDDHYQAHETRLNKAVPTRPMKLSRPRVPEQHTVGMLLPTDELRLMMEREALAYQYERDHPDANKDHIADIETAILPHRPSAQEIDNLKRCWLSMPIWDVEFSVGFEEKTNELAAWHDDQLTLKAKQMGCSHLMASVLEELVRCFIRGVPPLSPLAQRILASYS